MRKYFYKTILALFIIVLLTGVSFSEEEILINNQSKNYNDFKYVNSSKKTLKGKACFAEGKPEVIAKQFLREKQQLLSLQEELNDLIIFEVKEMKKSNFMVTFQQFYKNLPVFIKEVTVFIEDSCVYLVNHSYIPNINISIMPTISTKEAVEIAKNDYKYSCCRGRDKQGNLIIYNVDPNSLTIKINKPELGIAIFKDKPTLAHRFILDMEEPIYDLQEYSIDANNGEIIEKRGLVQTGGEKQ